MIRQECHAAYVANLLNVYGRASADDLARGRAWYPVGRELARMLGAGDIDAGAGVLAALSPRIHWATNIRDAQTVVSGRAAALAAFPANVVKARRILAGEPWRTVLTPGTKTFNFADNLSGSDDAVTVDAWAVGAALGLPGTSPVRLTPRQYAVMADAYRAAAQAVGMTPAAFQATVWTVQRGSAD